MVEGAISGPESGSANFSPFPVWERSPADSAPGDTAAAETIDAKVPGVAGVDFAGPTPSVGTDTAVWSSLTAGRADAAWIEIDSNVPGTAPAGGAETTGAEAAGTCEADPGTTAAIGGVPGTETAGAGTAVTPLAGRPEGIGVAVDPDNAPAETAPTPLAGRPEGIGVAADPETGEARTAAEGFVPGVKLEIVGLAGAPTDANVPGVVFGAAGAVANSGGTGMGAISAADAAATPLTLFVGFASEGVEALAAWAFVDRVPGADAGAVGNAAGSRAICALSAEASALPAATPPLAQAFDEAGASAKRAGSVPGT